MTLLQIHEPGQTPEPHAEDIEVAIGIDLGTTNSVISISENSKPEVIKDKLSGDLLYKSIVSYADDNIITGSKALDAGGVVISSIKRLMGKAAKDIKKISNTSIYNINSENTDEVIRLNVGDKKLTPIEISAEILKSLKQNAEDSLSKKVNKAVITVPAYFDDAARTATKAAARLAGLDVLRLINEPTAAALAYGLDNSAEGIYAIYDLGGGTFDITILKMEKGIFQVLSTGGSTEIGGDDFDREIAEILLWKYKNKIGKPYQPKAEVLKHILLEARKVKEALSSNEEVDVDLTIGPENHLFKISLKDFEQVISPYIMSTIDLCYQAIEDAHINLADIKGVVLVGGSTRVPMVRQKVGEFFQMQPLDDVDPDLVVSYGAAIQAEGLTKGSNNLLLDVIPLSLGLETMGGIVEKVIHRNTPIPVAKAQEFTTYQDGQTGMDIHVVQGEREMVSQNRSLAKFTLHNIPPMTAGAARIKVTFAVDADGILTVSAKEESTGESQFIEVKPSFGLTDKEIEGMIRSSMEHAKEDVAIKLFTQSKVEAEGLISAVNTALDMDSNILSDEQKQEIELKIYKLNIAIEDGNRDDIINRTKELEEATKEFASKRINLHIGGSLKGENIDDL